MRQRAIAVVELGATGLEQQAEVQGVEHARGVGRGPDRPP
jgi:hypothetical protein